MAPPAARRPLPWRTGHARCEEGASGAAKAVAETPNWMSSYRSLNIDLVELGRIEEARDVASRLLARDPKVRISSTSRFTPIRGGPWVLRYADALLRSGRWRDRNMSAGPDVVSASLPLEHREERQCTTSW